MVHTVKADNAIAGDERNYHQRNCDKTSVKASCASKGASQKTE